MHLYIRMTFKESALWIWWKEYGKHIEALIIILLLITVWFSYHKNTNELRDAKENHPCILQEQIKNIINDSYNNINKINIGVEDVKLDWRRN